MTRKNEDNFKIRYLRYEYKAAEFQHFQEFTIFEPSGIRTQIDDSSIFAKYV